LKELDKEYINCKLESFEWAKTLTKLRNLFFLLIFLIVLICEIFLLDPIITWVILPLDGLFILILLFGAKYLFDHSRILYFGKKRESKNVIATIQAKDLHPNRPVIIFSAHHDSVSSLFPTKFFMILILSGVLLLLFFIIINVILSIWSIIAIFTDISIGIVYIIIRNISLVVGIIILIELFITFFNRRTNQSIGSVDNASGVAVLLELAKLIKKNPLERTDVIFLWAGAEEMGIWGSKQYCVKHFKELEHDYDIDKSYNINVDMVGTYIGLVEETGLIKRKQLNENLNDVLKASDTHQMIPSKKSKLALGSGSDHLAFRIFAKKAEKNGFQISCFTSKKDGKYIHSKKDIPDLCSAENLNGCIDICYNAIKSLDLRVE